MKEKCVQSAPTAHTGINTANLPRNVCFLFGIVFQVKLRETGAKFRGDIYEIINRG